MQFTSYTFLLFLLAMLTILSVWQAWTGRKIVLLMGSYCFYAWANPWFSLVLISSTLLNIILARQMMRVPPGRIRAITFIVGICLNLGTLAVFKYTSFFQQNLLWVTQLLGLTPADWHRQLDIVLPLGISFYTFTTTSYLVDCYRGELSEPGKPLDVALYFAFFPKLISGPICRAKDFFIQCQNAPSRDSAAFGWGVFLCAWGFFKKVAIADNIAILVNAVYSDPAKFGLLNIWVAIFGYAVQIYCDFGGYTDIAIGVALLFGFSLPDNFKRPYAAIGFADFWQRWHISLSTWLRDYLYVPLGGNRKGRARTYFNIVVTMLLCGLWHGANWTFVLWGGIHGLCLCGERFIVSHWPTNKAIPKYGLLYSALKCVATFVMVSLLWVLFRAPSLSSAWSLLCNAIGIEHVGVLADEFLPRTLLTALMITVVVFWHYINRAVPFHSLCRMAPSWLLGVVASLLFIVASFLRTPDGDQFIYFGF